jgi:arginase
MKNAHIVSPFYIDQPVPRLAEIAHPGADVQQPPLDAADTQGRLSLIHELIADAVARAGAADERPVVVSGDCCATIGVMAGLQRAGIEPHFLWLDAHGDFNTWETSPSGFLGGMPLAMIVGRGELRMPPAVGLTSLPEERVTLVDGRDLDPEERIALAGSKVRHVRNAAALVEGGLPDGPLYVHFDTDILPAEEAPAMNYPVPGGPPSPVIRALFERLDATDRVVACSMSAWNPALDEDGSTERLCLDLFSVLTGEGR